MSNQEPTYCATPQDIPEEARATYEQAAALNSKLSEALSGSSFEVAVNAIVNLLVSQAVHGSKQTRDDMSAVLTHAIEYIKRLDMQAPAGEAIQ